MAESFRVVAKFIQLFKKSGKIILLVVKFNPIKFTHPFSKCIQEISSVKCKTLSSTYHNAFLVHYLPHDQFKQSENYTKCYMNLDMYLDVVQLQMNTILQSSNRKRLDI